MQFQPERRVSKRLKKEIVNDYEVPLQMFTVPPVECISLQEFEDLAVERVKGIFVHNHLIRHVYCSLLISLVISTPILKFTCNVQVAQRNA